MKRAVRSRPRLIWGLASGLLMTTIVAMTPASGQAATSDPATGTVGQAATASTSRRYDNLPDHSFATSRPWAKTTLTYHFVNGTPDIAGTGEKTAVRAALKLWSDAAPLHFTEVSGNADINFKWASGDHGDGDPFDGLGPVLAHAYPPGPGLGGDVHFDEAEKWTASTRTNGDAPFDLVSVAAHEIGHALGLDHSAVKGALMAPVYDKSHRFLSDDDKAGIRRLYPRNPYTAKQVCGSTYTVTVGSHDLGGKARVYLLYAPSSGNNCVVTLKTTKIGTASSTSAGLLVRDSTPSWVRDTGSFKYYAGPVRQPARKTCVQYSGNHDGSSWTSPVVGCG
jgi:Matrixin